MFGSANVTLQKHRLVPKGTLRFALCLLQERFQVRSLLHDAHSAPAPAKRGFDDEGESDALCDLERLFGILNRVLGARKGRHPRPLGYRPGRDLVSHLLQQFGTRSHERDPGLCTASR